MADFVVGISDGYRSVAYADALTPAEDRFSITSPEPLSSQEQDQAVALSALAEIAVGTIASRRI